jgi:hypothetical protein
MTAGRHAFARIAAVQMRLPEFAAEGFANSGTNAEIDKYNPRWDIEPRDWHGRWMGDNSGPVIPVIEPYSAECLQAIEAAKKLCIMEYTLRGGELGFAWMRQCIRQHVPSGCGY